MWPLVLLAIGAAVVMSSKGGRAAAARVQMAAKDLYANVSLPHAIPPLGNFPARISSPFGMRVHPTLHTQKMHEGVDLPAPVGTPVYAPVDGVVTRIDRDGIDRGVVNGNCVHMQGEGYGMAFLHLSRVDVAVGDRVVQGEQLGLVGTTGRSTGPHLHFQVTVSGQTVNPQLVLAVV